MSNPAYEDVTERAKQATQRGEIAVVVEDNFNNYAEPCEISYQLHTFSSESQYDAWLDEHYEESVIETASEDMLRRPELVHEGAMGEIQAVEVIAPERIADPAGRSTEPASIAVSGEAAGMDQIATFVAYQRPDLMIASTDHVSAGELHHQLHIYNEARPEDTLVVEATKGTTAAEYTYSIEAQQRGASAAAHRAEGLSFEEAAEKTTDMAALIPAETPGPTDAVEAIKHREALLASMTPEQLAGPGYTTGPQIN